MQFHATLGGTDLVSRIAVITSFNRFDVITRQESLPAHEGKIS
jgi:hypothetical protein